ncbi:MAG: hypothetical protein ASARMPRED_005149 [Alectoria sarmentosa]|nr:MAG: hypothetical protein ASARMPRED_005149 [Alectoria sarmentosa]
MSLAVTYKYQSATTIDDDLQAHMEAREIRESDAEGVGEGEEAEEPESLSEDDAQEDNENDNFDENADWSDEDDGKEYDIVRKYNFVWTESWEGEPKDYEGDSMTICGSADQNQGDEPFRCTANFTWRDFVAQFTCIYYPETETFTDFKAKRKTMDGGMEQICRVKIRMWEQGEKASEMKEVKDDHDHLFLFVQVDFGYDGIDDMVSYVYGKKAVEDGGEDNAVLTGREKERLRLPRSEYVEN